MATNPVTPPLTPEPLSVNFTGGTLTEILSVLSSALAVLEAIPQTAAGATLAAVVIQIITAAVSRVQSQTGRPIDLSLIPIEAPLP